MTTALDIINSAFERCNRLSPGETLGADDAALGFRRLNDLVDELSSKRKFLYLNVITSATQTGNITLGSGAWTSLGIGEKIVSMTANGLPMAPITMQQYNQIYAPTVSGMPNVWAQDGGVNVYLYPVPTNVVIKAQTQTTVRQFADLTTQYSMPAGWKSALSAALAVRIAPNIIGSIPPELLRADMKCMDGVDSFEPMIVDVDTYTGGRLAPQRILYGGF